MEFAESTDEERPIPKELTAFLNEVQNNLGLYPETVIYNRIKEYISVIPRKQIAWLTQTVIISTEFRVRILSTRCKSGDKLACEMLDLAVNGDEYSKNPTVQKGLMGLFRDENDIESGKLLVEIGVITREQYDKEIRSRKSGDLIDGKSYPDLLNDLAAESKKYPTADSFSMAMIMGKLESVPSPNTANVYKLIKGKYKTAEDFYNAVKKGEFELKKTEERKERIVEPEEAVSKPLVIKGVQDLELMKKEIQDKISEEKKRRLRGGGMAGEKEGKYSADDTKDKIMFISGMTDYIRAADRDRRKLAFDKLQASKFYREWFDQFFYVHDLKKAKELLMNFFGANEQGLDLLNHTFYGAITQYLKVITEPREQKVGEPVELPKDERLKLAKGIAATARGQDEPVDVAIIPHSLCPEIPGFIYCPTCKFKHSITSVISCPYRPEQTTRLREEHDVYSRWTYDDFKVIINRMTNIEDLMDLAKHIEDSKVMTSGEKVSARQLAETRKRDIVYGIPEIKRQSEQQERERKMAAVNRLREDDMIQEPPEDSKLWTFAEFEPLIYNEDDTDNLLQLHGTVNSSIKLTENEKTEIHELIDKQIREIEARS